MSSGAVLLVSGSGLRFCFELVFDVWCYCYILLYLILYYTLLFFLFFSSSFPSSLLFLLPIPLPIPTILYVSVLTYGYLYSRLISQSTILTPHVLSDGNVEWCSFNVCGVRLMFCAGVTCGVMLYIILLLYIYYYYILYYTLLFSFPILFLFLLPFHLSSSSPSSILPILLLFLLPIFVCISFYHQSDNSDPACFIGVDG